MSHRYQFKINGKCEKEFPWCTMLLVKEIFLLKTNNSTTVNSLAQLKPPVQNSGPLKEHQNGCGSINLWATAVDYYRANSQTGTCASFKIGFNRVKMPFTYSHKHYFDQTRPKTASILKARMQILKRNRYTSTRLVGWIHENIQLVWLSCLSPLCFNNE